MGVDIDSAENGVWLGHATHVGTFTNAYVSWINDQVVSAFASSGPSGVMDVLGETKSTLQALDQNFGNGL